MWYHDHAIDHTAENAYFGQAGGWIVHDYAEDALGLPSGYGKYDIPLILTSKVRRDLTLVPLQATKCLMLVRSNIKTTEPSMTLPTRTTASTAMSSRSTASLGPT